MSKTKQELHSENQNLRSQVEELQQALSAIRRGEVDAITVDSDKGEQIYSLSSAERIYRILIEQMNEGAAILSKKGVILYCNQRFAELLGQNMENITGRIFDQFIDKKQKERYQTLFKKGLSQKVQGDFKFGKLETDGRKRHLLLSINPIDDDELMKNNDNSDQKEYQLSLIATDITNYKNLQEQLYEYQSKLEEKVEERTEELKKVNQDLEDSQKASLNMMEDAVLMSQRLKRSQNRLVEAQQMAKMGNFTWNLETDEVEFSEALFDLLQYDESSEFTFPEIHQKIHHPDDQARIKEWLEEGIESDKKKLPPVEYRIIRQDDQILNVHAIGAVKRDQNKPTRVFWTIQDITEQKKIKQELENVNKELRTKNKELEQLLYATSHDLRSPLINVEGFNKELKAALQEIEDIIQKKSVPENITKQCRNIIENDIYESIHFILSSTSKMDALLSGLLALSRLGRQSLTMKLLDVNAIVDEVLSEFRYELQDKDVKVKVGELPNCKGDKLQISQIFSNLVSNAIKYLDSDQPGFIKIDGHKDDDRLIYSVKDNGIGIPKKQQKKIFNLFHKLDPNKPGIGLGLNIIKQSLDKHNGEIRVQSAPDEGTKFTIILPDN